MISGPSGAGKSTIVNGVLTARDVAFSVSATTRSPRAGEVEGVHYHFVEPDEFRRMAGGGAFLEWAQYGSNLYGTPMAPVLATLERGTDVLLEIEMQGARQVREIYPEAVMVFIRPPSMDVLEQRLRARGDTSDDDVRRRLAIARQELADAPDLFDHVVVNDRVETAVADVLEILDGERG